MNYFSARLLARPARLPDYGEAYFQHVLASLRAVSNDPPKWPEYVTDIVKSYEDKPSLCTWGQLYLIEKYVLSILPDNSLKRRAWALRNEYFELVGAVTFDKYLQSHPPNENDPNCDIAALRADLDRVLDALHWSYSLIPIRERQRTEIVRDLGTAVAVFVIICLGVVFLCSFYYETLIAALMVAMLSGAVGGFISLQQRVQSIPCDGDPLISIFELKNGRFSIFQAPVSGAIFAIALFFLFMGGLVSGQLFPNFEGLKLYIREFKWNGGYLWGPNYAKLIVWCFIAGFAERFVPDTLDRLIAKSRAGNVPQQGPAQPAPPFPSSQNSSRVTAERTATGGSAGLSPSGRAPDSAA